MKPAWLALTFCTLGATAYPVAAHAQEEEATEEDDWGAFEEAAAESETVEVFQGKFYGYVEAYFEQVADTPYEIDDAGNTVWESNPYEFDVPSLHVFAQGLVFGKYRYFVNLAGPGSGGIEDEPIQVRNAWVETPLPWFGDYLKLRAGKTYRRFGLYNEILDAVPTFIGIEPPELFDGDHLMLTRTTNLMLHGSAVFGESVLNYSVSTGNDERKDGAFPIGADLHLLQGTWLKIGTSFYHSGGDAGPSKAVGEGSPTGAVINWMDRDEYYVFGGYVQVQTAGAILQAAYWQAEHDATRNEEEVLKLVEGHLHPRQRERFFVNGDPSQGVNTDAQYSVQTFYFRGGYEFALADQMTLTPYLQADYYSNPETVTSKSLGGDAEAGRSDDGEFWKFTVGAVYRPVYPVALKIDGSGHLQQFNGETVFYPELRVSLSYLWEIAP